MLENVHLVSSLGVDTAENGARNGFKIDINEKAWMLKEVRPRSLREVHGHSRRASDGAGNGCRAVCVAIRHAAAQIATFPRGIQGSKSFR